VNVYTLQGGAWNAVGGEFVGDGDWSMGMHVAISHNGRKIAYGFNLYYKGSMQFSLEDNPLPCVRVYSWNGLDSWIRVDNPTCVFPLTGPRGLAMSGHGGTLISNNHSDTSSTKLKIVTISSSRPLDAVTTLTKQVPGATIAGFNRLERFRFRKRSARDLKVDVNQIEIVAVDPMSPGRRMLLQSGLLVTYSVSYNMDESYDVIAQAIAAGTPIPAPTITPAPGASAGHTLPARLWLSGAAALGMLIVMSRR
jgi:hypothetical protein